MRARDLAQPASSLAVSIVRASALAQHVRKRFYGMRSYVVLMIQPAQARLAQSAERKALNLVVVGSSPTVGVCQLPAPRIMT